MNNEYNQIQPIVTTVAAENWLETLKRQTNNRPSYHLNNGLLQIGQVVVRILGVKMDEDEYYNELFSLVNEQNIRFILLSEEHLDKTIDNNHFQSIQKIININNEQNLSVNRFVAFLDGEQLLIKSENGAIHRKIREAMIEVLKQFTANEKDGLKNAELRRVLVDLVKWSFNHLESQLIQVNPEISMPKILWYGETVKSHYYFLYFMLKLGCDMVIYNPAGKDPLAPLASELTAALLETYANEKDPASFPTEKRRRSATVAYRASREIESILNHEGSGFYKPWQLREYTPVSVTLKTTYDELYLLMKEKAMIRPNFEVKDGTVSIPSIFAKVQGVSRNRKEYWDRLQQLTSLDHTLLIKRFPFTNSINNDFRYHFRNALDKSGLLDPEKMISAHYWKYGHLPAGLQTGIATAIRNICAVPALKAQPHESEEDIKTYLFAQSMQIPPSMLKLFQKFDYSQDVPKVVLYNNEVNGFLVRTDAALLLLLNQFGIDVVIYNPPGHNDIENFIDESLYDVHWLEDVVFDQEFKEPSIIKSTISKLFKKL
ncbi:YceG family protein [Cytobacillus gottheilii]|uniref:YceG family protein n=1 Tax=Cytobacillus gottheilii TaxID=859144 RepID=UPI00249567EF|nr:YceG family protein [Cytobacillus gottheilii]